MRGNHEPNHRGNTSRGIGNIYDLSYVLETEAELDDEDRKMAIFVDGLVVVRKLLEKDIQFIEVK